MRLQFPSSELHLLKSLNKGVYVHSISNREVNLTLNPINAKRFKSAEDAELFSYSMPYTPYVFKPVFEKVLLID